MKKLHTAAAVAALALVLAGCVARENPSSESSNDGFTTAPTSEETEAEASETTSGDCGFTSDGSDSDSSVGLPPDEGPVGVATMTLTTSAGPIAIQLDEAGTPCTVQSMAFLAGEGFYDGVTCHRITGAEGLKVLQCGDPLGTGGGGPGYSIPDELTTAENLTAGPVNPSDGSPTVIYPRGIVAMANAGPDTGGSQFFLVYGDSTLPPNYTAFGTVDEAGLATLDTIAAGGITPGQNGPEDGTPTTPVTIETAEVA